MNIPPRFVQGDSATWTDEPVRAADGSLRNSAVYTLSYILAGPVAPVTLTATPDGTGWKTSLALIVSAALVPGEYAWQAVLSASGERSTIGSGILHVTANLANVTAGYDSRTLAEIALSDAEAALANLTASGKRVKQYAIGGRSAQYYTATELIAAVNFWRLKVINEQTAKSLANGLGNPRKLHVRFR